MLKNRSEVRCCVFEIAANLMPKSPRFCQQLGVERGARRADALPPPWAVLSMTDETLPSRGAFSNLQTIGNVVSRILCDYTASSPNGFAFAEQVDFVHATESIAQLKPTDRESIKIDRPEGMPVPNRLNVALVLLDIIGGRRIAVARLTTGVHFWCHPGRNCRIRISC